MHAKDHVGFFYEELYKKVWSRLLFNLSNSLRKPKSFKKLSLFSDNFYLQAVFSFPVLNFYRKS